MSKRVRDPVEVDAGDLPGAPSGAPRAFRWRGARYRVRAVLGHWREDAGYWAGGGIAVPQRNLWRVEATPEHRGAGRRDGVFEVVEEGGDWRLDRIWD